MLDPFFQSIWKPPGENEMKNDSRWKINLRPNMTSRETISTDAAAAATVRGHDDEEERKK
jgi:hypothetical protein